MRLLVLVITLFITQLGFAQYPSFTLYPVNPLLINPAFTGVHGQSEISLNHRQQWLGIENAPSVSTFQFDRAFTPQISLGLQARQVSRGALNTSLGNILFAYKVLLGQKTSLNFGLAGGLVSYGINSRSHYNPADPAVQNLLQGGINSDLRFGTNYHFKGLNLGVTFTEMLRNRASEAFLSDQGNVQFYENYIVNFDYKIHLKRLPLAIQPFAIYYHDKDLSSYVEGGTLIHYDDLLYLGGSYRQGYGAGVVAGVSVKDFQLSYGYEIASAMVNRVGQGSHEIQLSFKFGQVKEHKKANESQFAQQPDPGSTDTLSQVEPPAKLPEEEDREEEKSRESVVHTIEEASDTVLNTPDTEEPTALINAQHAVYKSGDHPNELPVGYYVVAGAYSNLENAKKGIGVLSSQGVFTGTGYNSDRNLYLVYVYRSDDLAKTREARDRYRKKIILKEAWLLQIK